MTCLGQGIVEENYVVHTHALKGFPLAKHQNDSKSLKWMKSQMWSWYPDSLGKHQVGLSDEVESAEPSTPSTRLKGSFFTGRSFPPKCAFKAPKDGKDLEEVAGLNWTRKNGWKLASPRMAKESNRDTQVDLNKKNLT